MRVLLFVLVGARWRLFVEDGHKMGTGFGRITDMCAVPEGPVLASSYRVRHRIWRLLPIPPPRTGVVLDRFRRREVHDQGLAAVILGRVLAN